MQYFSTITAIIILLGMCLLHLALLFGAPLGEFVLGGENKIIPPNKRYLNIIFSLIWFLGAIIYGEIGGLFHIFPLNSLFIRVPFYILTIFFGFAIFSNAFLTSSKKEKYTMVPACLLMFLCSIYLMFF